MQIKLFFLGQCIATGIGVRPECSYPMLLQQYLRVRYPSLSFPVTVYPLRHPQGLRPLLKVALRGKPDLVFLSLPGMFASIPSRVNLIYHQAPEVMPLARDLLRKLDARLRQDSAFGRLLATRWQWMPMKIFAPLSLATYEQTVRDALLYWQRHSSARVLLMGPGGFNEYSEDGNQTSPELANEINQMFLRLTKELNVTFVNAHELMAEQNSDVYLAASHRWSEQGHALVARELESFIALELTRMSAIRQLNRRAA
jgi:hypothetical protein